MRSAPGDEGFHPTAMFSRTNDHSQIHRPYIEAFGGAVNQFGDLSMPSFASDDAFTIFVPLAEDWRALIGGEASLEWSFYPRVNVVPKLDYTFGEDDLEIAERVDESCLSIDELGRVDKTSGPQANARNINEAEEADGGLVVAGGHAATVLEFPEAAFDQVA